MICPQCGQDNKETAKFCNECGTHLEINCPRCSKVNPQGMIAKLNLIRTRVMRNEKDIDLVSL